MLCVAVTIGGSMHDAFQSLIENGGFQGFAAGFALTAILAVVFKLVSLRVSGREGKRRWNGVAGMFFGACAALGGFMVFAASIPIGFELQWTWVLIAGPLTSALFIAGGLMHVVSCSVCFD